MQNYFQIFNRIVVLILSFIAGVNLIGCTNEENSPLDRTIFETARLVAYLHPEVSEFKGALVFLPGADDDTRHIPYGGSGPEFERSYLSHQRDIRDELLPIAETYGLAIVGGTGLTTADDQNMFVEDVVIAGLNVIAEESGHQELVEIPLLLDGFSASSCPVLSFTTEQSDRVIGFVFTNRSCSPRELETAASVPGFFYAGEGDRGASLFVNLRVEQMREADVPWMMTIEPGGLHTPIQNPDLYLAWLEGILSLRLGEETLRPLDITAGWLGDHSSFAIGPYDCYTGEKATASWFPSEETAREWQSFVSSGEVSQVLNCS